MITESYVRIAELQQEIEANIKDLESDRIIFEFKEGEASTSLHLVTVNPRHNQSFLFHSTEGRDQIEALELMLDYVKTYRQEENTYTIQWMNKGDTELQTSYFWAHHIQEALDKFYHNTSRTDVTIFSVVLNPIA